MTRTSSRSPTGRRPRSTASTACSRIFGAGFAFVRGSSETGGHGYLAVTDGFHNLTHKHGDELSFELYDDGRSIVNDTGLFHKDPGPIRDYVV